MRPGLGRRALLCYAASAALLGPCVAAGGEPPADGAEATAASPWSAVHFRDHPLVGRIWDGNRGAFADETAMLAAAAGARFVLLGETHDNPDHHRLQAHVLRAVLARGRRPALAFEMIGLDQVRHLEAQLEAAPRDASGLGAALQWETRGWNSWAMYRPIAQAALDAGLPIVAADLARDTVRDLARRGPEALDPALVERLTLEQPDDADVVAAMLADIKESHCGRVGDDLAQRMVTTQRVRDGFMAMRLVEAGAAPGIDGAVLIAGAGHARRDRGVPLRLSDLAPGATVLSVGFIQVSAERRDPTDYAAPLHAPALPFDFVLFTPRADVEDPCSKYGEGLRRLGDK